MKTFVRRSRQLLFTGLSALLLGTSACKKAEKLFEEKMPAPTQEGKNTFGCLVDGQLWLPSTQSSLDNELETDYYPLGNALELRAENERGVAIDLITLKLKGPIQPGTYTLGNGFSATCNSGAQYQTPATGPGFVTITKVEPKVNNGSGITTYSAIISGTFEFTALNAATGKSVTVKDGRFDVNAPY